MAEEIRYGRVQLSKAQPSSPVITQPIGKRWIDRFRSRHPEIQGVWTRQIESARHKATSFEAADRWFTAVTTMHIEHQYRPEHVYNMDESGFAVGASQSSRALVNIREASSWKVINGRQEWITAIECVHADGGAIPPLIIFKAKHTNTGWRPKSTPRDWCFSTSNSGWTSDSHGYKWLTTVFQPSTLPPDPTTRRLLIMDGHSSHITANVIRFCIQNAIDLLILPPHTSHLLQPLDVGVFSSLKRALASETDAAARLSSSRITRVEWVEMYIRARNKAITHSNILSGWRATGLEPLSPVTVLDKLASPSTTNASSAATDAPDPHTPPAQLELDLSLLDSSPPDRTDLRSANALLNSALKEIQQVPAIMQRYIERTTRLSELEHSEKVILRQQVEEQKRLLSTRKERTKGERIAVKGQFMFSTEEILKKVEECEAETAAKKAGKQARKRVIDETLEEDEIDDLENTYSQPESDCIGVAVRK
ncbi:hypothetical protein KCU83_g8029, partial [Aureobasidium melanogenum]